MTPELREAIPTGIAALEEECAFVERLLRLNWKPDKRAMFERKVKHFKTLIEALKQSL